MRINSQKVCIDYINTNYLDFDRLRFDTISGKPQIRTADNIWKDISNSDINDIVCDIALTTDAAVSGREVLAVLNSHQVPHVHPLRDWLNALPAYQPAYGDAIAELASQVQVKQDEKLWHDCFRKWFVAMVAAWLYDDVVNQQVLVLIGQQGIFKTTWLDHLIPTELCQYACKMASSREFLKDDRMRIAEFGLIALDEIDAMTSRELNHMKSIITASDVNERAAYAYTKERRVRLASFCASGNKKEFLSDLTGNRRWLPFEVESIQNPFFTTLPYQLIYAQAVWLIQQGFNYWFEQEDITLMEQHNEDFREQMNEEQLLSVYFAVPADDASSARFMTTAEISDKLVINGSIKRPMNLSQLGTLLAKAGYKSARKVDGNQRPRGWIVYERSTDEINIERIRMAHLSQ